MKDKSTSKLLARAKRRQQINKKIRGQSEKPRLVVTRSNKHVSGQLIDDVQRITIVFASTTSKEISEEIAKAKTKVEKAKIAGKYLGKIAKEKQIEKIVFDRAGYLYHGRIKAFADGAREGGLVF